MKQDQRTPEEKKTKRKGILLLKFLCAAMAACGAVQLLLLLLKEILIRTMELPLSTGAYSIGVIGGADGPTAIFVTSSPVTGHIVALVLLVVGTWGFIRLCKCTKK